MRIDQKKSLALVLSGGGIKAAAFHIGVCTALREKGFTFSGGLKNPMDTNKSKGPLDPSATVPPNNSEIYGNNRHRAAGKYPINMYVGSSAGALVCAILASGYSIESLIEAFETGNKLLPAIVGRRPNPGSLRPINYWDIFSLNHQGMLHVVPSVFKRHSLVAGGLETFLKEGIKVNGLFTTRGIEKYLRNHVLPTNKFQELGPKLFIVATQLNHSRKAVFGPFEETTKTDDIKLANFATISQAVAASASLPPVFAPYGIRNSKGKEIHFFDGEIRDTLSTHVASDHGADLVISSYSIQPYHFTPQMGSLHKYGIPIIMNQALYQVVQQKIANHIKYQKNIRTLISAVDGYFKEANLPPEHREKLVSILEEKVHFHRNVDHIYIHPDPNDFEMFFVDHFSLNSEILGRIVKVGFKAAMRTLRRYDM